MTNNLKPQHKETNLETVDASWSAAIPATDLQMHKRAGSTTNAMPLDIDKQSELFISMRVCKNHVKAVAKTQCL